MKSKRNNNACPIQMMNSSLGKKKKKKRERERENKL